MRVALAYCSLGLALAACAGTARQPDGTTAELPPVVARTAQPARPADAELRSLDTLWARVYAEHDTAAAERLYADDLVFQSANGNVKTKSEEMRDIRPQPGLVMEFFRTEPATIRVAGDSGFVSGVASWRFTMGGQPREVRRTYEATYARGGPLGWRIVRMRMGRAP